MVMAEDKILVLWKYQLNVKTYHKVECNWAAKVDRIYKKPGTWVSLQCWLKLTSETIGYISKTAYLNNHFIFA